MKITKRQNPAQLAKGEGLFASEGDSGDVAPRATPPDADEANGPRSGPPPRLHKLDSSRNNVTGLKPTGRVLVACENCRARTCENCGRIYGRKVRARLLDRAEEFKHPAMFTLTLKPSRFGDDPERAFLEVTGQRYIARLMKKLGVKRYVWVLECQQSGWPHWHLLIDKPNGFVNLKIAWKWWGWDKSEWKLGGVNLSDRQATDGRQAILYITKYLVKYPAEGFPNWILDLKGRRIRWVGSSKAIGRIVSDREPTAKDAKGRANQGEAEDSLPLEPRSLRERQAHCGKTRLFLREFVDLGTGTITYQMCGRLGWNIYERARDTGTFHVERDEVGREFILEASNDFRETMKAMVGSALGGSESYTMRRIRVWEHQGPPREEDEPIVSLPLPCIKCGQMTGEREQIVSDRGAKTCICRKCVGR